MNDQTIITIVCNKCDGRGFTKAVSRVLANQPSPYRGIVAAYCNECDGRGKVKAKQLKNFEQ